MYKTDILETSKIFFRFRWEHWKFKGIIVLNFLSLIINLLRNIILNILFISCITNWKLVNKMINNKSNHDIHANNNSNNIPENKKISDILCAHNNLMCLDLILEILYSFNDFNKLHWSSNYWQLKAQKAK